MKIKSFYKEGDKNVIEYEDGIKEYYEKDYLTQADIVYLELKKEIDLVKAELSEIKKKSAVV